MKQSLIITAILCLALGQSFSFISKKEKAVQKTTSYCSLKKCEKQADKQLKSAAELESYIPMVNILGYN
jgi:hypothetical protein